MSDKKVVYAIKPEMSHWTQNFGLFWRRERAEERASELLAEFAKKPDVRDFPRQLIVVEVEVDDG